MSDGLTIKDIPLFGQRGENFGEFGVGRHGLHLNHKNRGDTRLILGLGIGLPRGVVGFEVFDRQAQQR